MSLYESTSRLLALGPQVSLEGKSLFVRTAPLLRGLTLFSHAREVEFNLEHRDVTIRTRAFWRTSSERRITFSEIAYLDYGFGSVTTEWNSLLDATDQVESFTIALVLHSQERVPIGRSVGEGSVATGGSGVLLGDDWVDVRGDQQESSLELVEQLAGALEVPVGKPLYHARDQEGRRWECAGCARPSPPNRKKCQYCGDQVVLQQEPPLPGGTKAP